MGLWLLLLTTVEHVMFGACCAENRYDKSLKSQSYSCHCHLNCCIVFRRWQSLSHFISYKLITATSLNVYSLPQTSNVFLTLSLSLSLSIWHVSSIISLTYFVSRYLATASSDKTVKIWNVDGFKLEKVLTGMVSMFL